MNPLLLRSVRKFVPPPVRAPLRAVWYGLRNIRGDRLVFEGVVMRFRVGAAPPAECPPSSEAVAYADWFATRAFFRAIRPGDWVADVGAFQGTYSVLAAHAAGPDGRVSAFEPMAGSVPAFARNMRINGVASRVERIAAAVGDVEGQITLYTAGTSQENSILPEALPASARDRATIRVPMLTLDRFFAARGRDPAVAKIDVEGFEFGVLRGAERIVRGPARIFCELHPYAWSAAGHDWTQLAAWLAERGRTVIDLRTSAVQVDTPMYGLYELARTAP